MTMKGLVEQRAITCEVSDRIRDTFSELTQRIAPVYLIGLLQKKTVYV